MRVVSLSSEQKANLLIAHLEGIAREKVEDLPEEERPHQRNLARQALASCKQVPGHRHPIDVMLADRHASYGTEFGRQVNALPAADMVTSHASALPHGRKDNGSSTSQCSLHVCLLNETDNSASLLVYAQLFRFATSAMPAYAAVSEVGLLRDMPINSIAWKILDNVYGATRLTVAAENQQEYLQPSVADDFSLLYHGRRLVLTEDQRQALQLGLSNYPIIEIQAAFGTGKTVIGACIAALLVQRGHRIVITASTNVAVAQITETILGVDLAAGMPLCRFVAETVQYDESVPRTAVDMNEVLKSFADRFRKVLSDALLNTCERYRRGRILVDDHHRNRIPAGRSLTPLEREELLVAERDVSDLMEDMVAIMFRWYCPDILLITTSSLLNTTSAGGIFRDYLSEFDILLCDEASQVPEPVFAAMLSRLPQARHIYIGDLHQLEPFARCSRSTSAALLGARSMIDVLTRARAVPAASLITTFRAHPGLNDLPNQVVYSGTLRSGSTAESRRLLLDVMQFPNESLPFVFIDVDGVSRRSTTMSHTNESEAEVCRTIVHRLIQRGIEPASIGLITFYRDQHRHLAGFARSVGVDLATVDSIQGREKDVIILLTTRTHFTPETGEFIDDVHRVNVALTRCRHGQFVLGHQLSLVAVPVWDKVLTWAHDHGALVRDVDMEEYLPAL